MSHLGDVQNAASLLSNADFVMINGVGHMAPLEAPVAVSRALASFVDRLEGVQPMNESNRADAGAPKPDAAELLRRQAEDAASDPAGPSALVTDPAAAEGGRAIDDENEQREEIEG